MTTTKFLLFDDHSIVFAGIQLMLKEYDPNITLHYVKTSKDLFEAIKADNFDLFILDVNVLGNDISGTVYKILLHDPGAKILVFSMNPENIFAKPLLKLGVKGYLSKDASEEEYCKALDTVMSGKIYMSENLLNNLSMQAITNTSQNPFDRLSERELAICKLLIQGNSSSEICLTLNIQSSTVGTYKARLFEKLGVTNLMELKKITSLYNFLP